MIRRGANKISLICNFLNTGRLFINKRFWELLVDCKSNGYGSKHCKGFSPLNWNYWVWCPASWIKPCLGLRFHGDILNLKCRKMEKNVTYSHSDSCESFKFIHFTGWATKSDGFFPYSFMLFTKRFVYWLYAVGWFSLFFSWPILISCVSLTDWG